MAHAAPARITCSVCDGWYPSERELREHMQAAHRRFVSAPSAPQYAGTQTEILKTEPRTPTEEWPNSETNPIPLRPETSIRR
jgi:hypothetical protein